MIRTQLLRVVPLLAVFSACGMQSKNCSLLQQHVQSLSITIGLYPYGTSRDGDPGGGLRSVILHQGILLEPHARWGRGGDPISSDAKISQEALLAIVEDFERLGVWANAERSYSIARKEPRFDPPAGSTYVPQQKNFPHCKVRASYTSEDYHSMFIAWVPWGEQTERLLGQLREHIPQSIADELAKTFERFRIPA